MNDDPAQRPPQSVEIEKERTKRTSSVSTIAICTAGCAFLILVNEPTWPAAFGVMAMSGMAVVVCYYILHQK